MDLKFLYNKPAILYKGAFIIGDTHFGIEERLKEKGINLDFSKMLLEKLKKDFQETDAEKLIILGDIKHKITGTDYQTEKILEELNGFCDLKIANVGEGNFQSLCSSTTAQKVERTNELIIVKGNHDGGLEELGLKVIPPSGFVYKSLGLIHGHSWPKEELMNAKYLIMAHQHPLYEFKDKFGIRKSEPAFIFSNPNIRNLKKHFKKFNEEIQCILIPAYNPLIGSSFNVSEKKLGPIFYNNLFKWNSIMVYNIKGILLRCFNGKKKTRP